MSDREVILGRIRSALRGTERVPADRIPRHYLRQRFSSGITELFCERVADYRATVRRAAPEQVPEQLVAALRAAGARKVLLPAGAPETWRERLAAEFEQVHDDSTATVDSLDEQTDAVVTTAAVAIAATGTIVLDHGPGQGKRAVTLVPDVHVCVVREEQIVDDVPAGMARLDPHRPLTFISGPSATSDIELDRVEGVHGPRNLHVVVAAG